MKNKNVSDVEEVISQPLFNLYMTGSHADGNHCFQKIFFYIFKKYINLGWLIKLITSTEKYDI